MRFAVVRIKVTLAPGVVALSARLVARHSEIRASGRDDIVSGVTRGTDRGLFVTGLAGGEMDAGAVLFENTFMALPAGFSHVVGRYRTANVTSGFHRMGRPVTVRTGRSNIEAFNH
jgi:hypothetical protein